MSGFGKILERSKKAFNAKLKGGKWGRCDECDSRTIVYPYKDDEEEIWTICEECIMRFAKEEGEK